MLHTVEWLFILFAFYAIGFPIIYSQSRGSTLLGSKLEYYGDLNLPAPTAEEKKAFIGETFSEPSIDINEWDTYRNQLYGFEINHPKSWTNLQYRTAASKNSRYETIYKFRKDSSGENDPYVGFDVVIYSTKKAGNLESTDDLKKIENAPEDMSNCQSSEDFTLGEDNNVFQQMSVKKDDPCYEPVYFFSIKKNSYLYDIIPVAKEGADLPDNIEQDVNKNFPEYKQVVASFKFIPIFKPPAASNTVSQPRITAPHPVSAIVVGGQLVCAKKNDHPSYSTKTHHKHLDMECCLDPDEYPNPWCTYSNPIYKKFL